MSKKLDLVVVLGMHRSGTSSIARGLRVIGVELGNNFIPDIPSVNAKGFWEDAEINDLNIRMQAHLGIDWHFISPISSAQADRLCNDGFLLQSANLVRLKVASARPFGFKDPRTGTLMPFWQRVFEHCRLNVGYVLALRHPISVADSLRARDGFDYEKSYLLWLEHTLQSLTFIQGKPRVVVDFDSLIEAPDKQIARVSRLLGLEVNERALALYRDEFLDPILRHTRYLPEDVTLDKRIPPILVQLYSRLLAAARDDTGGDAGLEEIKDFYPSAPDVAVVAAYVDRLWLDRRNLGQSADGLRAELANVAGEAHAARESLEAKECELSALKESLARHEAEVGQFKSALLDRDMRLESLTATIAQHDALIEEVEKRVRLALKAAENKETELTLLKDTIANLEAEIGRINSLTEDRGTRLISLTDSLARQLAQFNVQAQAQEERLRMATESVQIKDSEIARLKDAIFIREDELIQVKATLADREARVNATSEIVEQHASTIKVLKADLIASADRVNHYETTLSQQSKEIAALRTRDEALEASLSRVISSNSFKLTKPLRWMRRRVRLVAHVTRLARQYMKHRGGLVAGGLKMARRSLEIIRYSGVRGFLQRLRDYSVVSSQRAYLPPAVAPMPLESVGPREPAEPINSTAIVSPHPVSRADGQGYRFWENYELPTTVDVIVCVHNALDDVKNCLSSLVRFSSLQCNIIVVDDGSRDDTRDYLREFCAEQSATLLRNEIAQGYTFAANQGMRASSAGYVILLNSDTIVTPGWLEKMVACADSEPSIGLVGPLSNTASWQSIPKIDEDGDWATNPLPDGFSAAEMGELVAKYSGRVYPKMSFLNGFCLLICREVIEDIGLFDEEMFGRGYGEENDYCLRARKAGWLLALADNAYVYHAQSKSYSDEKRKSLADHAGMQLVTKHGGEIIRAGVEQCRSDRILVSIRARAGANLDRERVISLARSKWASKSILFVLPIMHAGGGGNVVITEARAMTQMGVRVALINLSANRKAFEQSYPRLDVKVLYVDSPAEISAISKYYDAVIATANHTVQWIAPLQALDDAPILGYYIQDFEPYFFKEGTAGFKTAIDSYTLISDIRMFTKTEWNRKEVFVKTGRNPVVVGPSVDVDLFFPRHQDQQGRGNPVHIVAMVRPSSPRRNAEGTIELLVKLKKAYGDRINVSIFGAEIDGPAVPGGDAVLSFSFFGQLTPEKTALLLSSADLFIDMSHFQAMGLTAMEAMACGAVPLVPLAGGADSYAQRNVNALVIDTSDIDAAFCAMSILIDDSARRREMQAAALTSVARFFPERSASLILDSIFS